MIKQLMVDNLRCDGCAAAIKKELKKIEGVIGVEVFPENSEVDVSYNENANLNVVYERLNSIGYPLTGIGQGSFERITATFKSYISCAIVKLSKPRKDDKSQDPK